MLHLPFTFFILVLSILCIIKVAEIVRRMNLKEIQTHEDKHLTFYPKLQKTKALLCVLAQITFQVWDWGGGVVYFFNIFPFHITHRITEWFGKKGTLKLM